MKENDWYNAYVTLIEKQGDEQKAYNIREMVKSIWDLFADKVNQVVFDQFAEEDGVELFRIEMLGKIAVRHYLKDNMFIPLFNDDIYDYLIVGMAQEVIEERSICDDLLDGHYLK